MFSGERNVLASFLALLLLTQPQISRRKELIIILCMCVLIEWLSINVFQEAVQYCSFEFDCKVF